MSNIFFGNDTKLIEQLSRFIAFIQHVDKREGIISFRDSKGFLGREEDYKSKIAEEAREELHLNQWKESLIGKGIISQYAINAMNKSSNLVNINQRIDFINRLNPKHKKYSSNAEKALYDLYKNPLCDDSIAFEEVTEAFGKKYDTIAYLFFIKDDTRFLPISCGHFDKAFKILNVKYETTRSCSWKNYIGFIDIIRDVRLYMEEILPMNGNLRLIDAHSFIWIIQESIFTNWNPNNDESIKIEETIERILQTEIIGSIGRRTVNSVVYKRSSEVVKETKKRANGICQLCNQLAPFNDKNGEPYLEVHHIVWLSRGGEDSTNNTVALCPNCHKKMHILDQLEDVDKLKEKSKKNFT